MAARKPPTDALVEMGLKPKTAATLERHGVGAPPYEPTDEMREAIAEMSGMGLPQKMIATLAKISEPTLVKYYGHELEFGKAEATLKVAKTLFARGMAGELAALIFWLKAQAGWREKHVLDDPNARMTLADLVLASGLSSHPEQGKRPEDMN